MPRIPLRVALPAAVLLLAAGGCSSATVRSSQTPAAPPSAHSAPSSPGTSISPPTATTGQIVIDNFAFSPTNLTVHPGENITVINHDSTTHTLTARSGGAFDTGAINPGKSATFTAPTAAGAYPYVCSIHASMHGTLTVG
ncbi:cupredoxin domain-containing protein [Streptacidiphilus rugosus]|uniref:cupredoxin domain-containing protein n=1 Tax=Streptacidiphilus rugosus TaxID=405783 RepID=UPI0007C6FD59|nr:cupredoxin domain-containing protein [Streptacidiphilus rugosus]